MTVSEELEQLGDLHRRGVLTDDEFARAKARVLDGSARPADGPNWQYGNGAPPRAGAARAAIHGLRRSRDDRWLGGVCAGIGEITDMPPWVWRLLFVAAVLCAGSGIVLYLLLWLLLPEAPPRPWPPAGGTTSAV